MIAPRHPRASTPIRGWMAAAPRDQRWPDRLLHACGVQSTFVDAVLGDLTEERVLREEEAGMAAARWWYVTQLIRSLPHLVRNAVRFGSPIARARLALVGATLALMVTVALAAFLFRDGPPARLVFTYANGAEAAEGITVNYMRPVQLPLRVLDAKGHTLESTNVRFEWASGAPVRVSSTGSVTCKTNGDATVRAFIGATTTTLLVRCRPVEMVRANHWITLVAGDSALELPFQAVGPDGRPVSPVAGELRVGDSTVVTLEGSRMRPLAPGHTEVTVRVGDSRALAEVSVFQRVPTLDHLRADDDLVAAPIRLERGASLTWVLPQGLFWLEYHGARAELVVPRMEVDGAVMCMREESAGPEVVRLTCLARDSLATIHITNPASFKPIVEGTLSFERQPVEERAFRPSPTPSAK